MTDTSKARSNILPTDIFFGASADLPRIVEIDLARIIPNPDQPRRDFDLAKLQELAASIAESGLIHPITVKALDRDHYMVIAGERRFRAYGLLDRKSIPAIISDGNVDELALIENIQREDLSPMDEADAVARLIEKHAYTQADAARVLGKSRVTINQLLTLKTLAPQIQAEARTAKTPKSTLIELAQAGDEDAQLKLWRSFGSRPPSIRTVREAKSFASTTPAAKITAALRAGRQFKTALDHLPLSARAHHAEIEATTERLLSLLELLLSDTAAD